MLPIWEPLTQSHTQTQVRPQSPFSIPSPTPRALAETYRPGRCPSTGPTSRASGPAPTWLRRSGRAERRGWGADQALLGSRGQGKGLGEGETLSRLPPPPEGVRKRSRRVYRRVRAAFPTTTRTRKAAAPENDPRSLKLCRIPGTEAILVTRQQPSTPPPISDAARHRRRCDVSAHAARA